MPALQNHPVKINSYPIGWPTDNRSRAAPRDGKIILSHPDRKPHEYDSELKRWREIV